MSTPSTDGVTEFPLRLGSDSDFESVRAFLAAASFDDRTLCRVLGMADMSDLGRVNWPAGSLTMTEPLRTCVEVFVRGQVVEESTLLNTCGRSVLDAAAALGLLRPLPRSPERRYAPVWLYPADGFVIASDRHDNPAEEVYTPPADVVFPAIYGGTLRFLALLPEAAGGDALDLCGGSGIGAFRLARTASLAATSDLTPRSAHFAAFNARLNRLPVESLCGDLYAPVAGRRFDLITAHPPFVPSTGSTMVYRDAGETGEDVTRGVIAGLPAHLRPGGRCVVLCVARDTHEQPIQERVRDWLGPAAAEFDVLFALEKVLAVDEVVESLRKRGQAMTAERAAELRDRLLAAATRQFVYGALLLQRYPEGCRLKPGRVRMRPETTIADFDRLWKLRQARNGGEFLARLPESRPRLAPALELRARHVVRAGELVPAEFVFAVEGNLPTALRTDGFVVPLIARLTGHHTVREVFSHAAGQGELPPGFPLEAFVGLVADMMEEGILEPATD